MKTFYVVLGFFILLALLYSLWSVKSKNKSLLDAVHTLESFVRKDIPIRDSERNNEFILIKEQFLGLMKDAVGQLYSGDMQLVRVDNDFKEDLAALVSVLSETPDQYLGLKLGEFISPKKDEFDGLELVKQRAPGMMNICYIELFYIMRIMIAYHMDMSDAYKAYSEGGA